jgi:hypothetical protein
LYREVLTLGPELPVQQQETPRALQQRLVRLLLQ